MASWSDEEADWHREIADTAEREELERSDEPPLPLSEVIAVFSLFAVIFAVIVWLVNGM